MNKSSLSLSISSLYQSQQVGHFIKNETVQGLAEEISGKLAKTDQKIEAKNYDFIEELRSERYLTQVETTLDNLKWAETLVVIGIGGSDLGGRALIEAFYQQDAAMKVLFVGDTTDPVSLKRLLDQINLNKTVFNVVSKSGGTLETLSTYVFFKAQVKKITANWAKHFVFTTSSVSGILKEEAERHSVMVLPVPEGVGGRFSVLTPVGLLPALAIGIDIKKLTSSAYEFSQNSDSRMMAKDLAKAYFELFHQNIKIAVMMTYSVQLQEFARWYRQLFAESLGKNDTGILPIKAWGPADQHSQLQFYNEGTPLQSVLIIKVENRKDNFVLSDIDVPEAQYLNGKDFNQLVNLEAEATATSLTNHGRPNALLGISELDEKALGELFMLFELTVVYLADLFEVNGFDQPGVEESKKLVNQALTK